MITCAECKNEIDIINAIKTKNVYFESIKEQQEVHIILCESCNHEHVISVKTEKLKGLINSLEEIQRKIELLVKTRQYFSDESYDKQYNKLMSEKSKIRENIKQYNNKMIREYVHR